MSNRYQEYILEQVYYVPLFAPNNYYAVSARVNDVSFNTNYVQFDFSAATIEE